ncbi:MAG TPA: hypothetical protein VN695_00920 [Streptosporangiaceae bacterium]|nr:hypothetical protein [Streptosporangiaceae bacterium]
MGSPGNCPDGGTAAGTEGATPVGTKRATGYGYSLWEFQVFGN